MWAAAAGGGRGGVLSGRVFLRKLRAIKSGLGFLDLTPSPMDGYPYFIGIL